MIKVIPLRDGKYLAIVDKDDFKRIKKFFWHVHFSKGTKRKVGQPYARANIEGKKVYLHRFIMNAEKGTHVDHVNHCSLDCRKCNLEVTTPSENIRRRRKR